MYTLKKIYFLPKGHMNLVNDVKRLKEDNLVLQKDLEVVFDGRHNISRPKQMNDFFLQKM